MARGGHGLRDALTLGGQVPAAVGGLLAALALATLVATVAPALGGWLTLDVEPGWGLLQAWRYVTWPFLEEGGPVTFAKDGKSLVIESSLGSDTTRVLRVDAASGKELAKVAENPKADAGSVMVHPDTYEIQAVGFNYLKNEWTVLDPAIKGDF